MVNDNSKQQAHTPTHTHTQEYEFNSYEAAVQIDIFSKGQKIIIESLRTEKDKRIDVCSRLWIFLRERHR